MIKYLSPSGLACWESGAEDWFLRYECGVRSVQTQPMAVGSAFDAYVKARILRLSDAGLSDLLHKQVAGSLRVWAAEAGRVCMDAYVACGAWADLMEELSSAASAPRCEFGIGLTIGGVPLYGIPDLFYQTLQGMRVINDWKVNGYCSKASPRRGYLSIRPGGASHRDCVPCLWRGSMINVAEGFECVDSKWADQLTTYAWLSGESVGSQDWILGIDQLACKSTASPSRPDIRVARHRARVGREWQELLLKRYQSAWEIIHSGWLFRDLSRGESQDREGLLRAANGDDEMSRMML